MGQPEHDTSHSGRGEGPQPAEGIGSADSEFGGRPPEMRSVRARLVTRLFHTYFVLTRSMTLGVRAACFDAEDRVFLVRHSYVPGWQMPGGGVERGQMARQALARELAEEGNLVIVGAPELFAFYYNQRTSKRDHVAFYRARVRQTAPKRPDREIIETGFFALDALPQGTTAATRRRLEEIAGTRAIDEWW